MPALNSDIACRHPLFNSFINPRRQQVEKSMRHFTRTLYYSDPDDPEKGKVRGTLQLGETAVIETIDGADNVRSADDPHGHRLNRRIDIEVEQQFLLTVAQRYFPRPQWRLHAGSPEERVGLVDDSPRRALQSCRLTDQIRDKRVGIALRDIVEQYYAALVLQHALIGRLLCHRLLWYRPLESVGSQRAIDTKCWQAARPYFSAPLISQANARVSAPLTKRREPHMVGYQIFQNAA
jgi:hypothetical protein